MGKRSRDFSRSGASTVPTAHASARGSKMAAHLLALTADGGVPIFTRKLGDLKSLPFALVGTLNGVNLYSRLRGAQLLSTTTREAKVVWKVFQDSIVLIIVTNDEAANDQHLEYLLDNIFSSMVMLVGLDNLTNVRNVDKVKRDLKVSYTLVDHFLQQLDQDLSTVGDLTGSVDCILCSESQSLQNYLDAFVESADSAYGCLLVRGKVVVATKKWWSLTGQEMALLSAFVNSSPKTTTRDVPIYLPSSCPTVCNRLLTFHLMQGVDVCVLCGPSPTLEELEQDVPHFWKGAFELLKSTTSLHPRNFPSSMTIDRNIMGLMLVQEERHKCLCSVQPLEEEITRIKEGKCISLRRRQEILRALYKIVVGTYFAPSSQSLNDKNKSSESGEHKGKELYFCMEHYKSYILKQGSIQLFLLFTPSIPTYAMRSVAHRTLKSLTSSKLYQL